VRESGRDLTFRLEEHFVILGTTDFLALIYEYEIDIVTGVREVFDADVEPDQCFDLALFPRSVNAYANQHRGLSRAGQQLSVD
jgi:alpha,alpha-trehalase